MTTEIVCDPAVMLGKPVFAGTRLTVELILAKLAAGESIDQIARAHPHLPSDAVFSALRYAAAVVANEIVVPFGRFQQ